MYPNTSIPCLQEYPAHLFYPPRSSSPMTKIKWYLPPRLSQEYFALVSLIPPGLDGCLSCPSTVLRHNTALLLEPLLSGWDLTFLRLQLDGITRTGSGTQLFVSVPYMSGQVYGWTDLVQGQRSENHQTESNHVELPRINLSWVCAHMFKVPWAKIKERTNSTKSLWPLRFCFLQK